jgi:hypothetical protein
LCRYSAADEDIDEADRRASHYQQGGEAREEPELLTFASFVHQVGLYKLEAS